MRAGIVATSFVVPQVELKSSIARLKASGIEAIVAPEVKTKHLFFAGKDEDRARAFYEMASRDDIDLIWCARGGYGAGRVLPLLSQLTARHGVPGRGTGGSRGGKLLVGYSDITAMHSFVRSQWGWRTLHAPMPGSSDFAKLSDKQYSAILDWIRGGRPVLHSERKPLKWIGGARPGSMIEAELIGGNLTVLVSLLGTPLSPMPCRGKILFIEEVSEGFYRIDRYLRQYLHSGLLEGVRAIVLGTFEDCQDSPGRALASEKEIGRKKPKYKPLRPTVPLSRALVEIFGSVGEALGAPVYAGLPVGHGTGLDPLPLHAKYRLSPGGKLEFLSWL